MSRNSVCFYVKTRNLSFDQRVLNEIRSVRKFGATIALVVYCDDERIDVKEVDNLYRFRFIGSAASKNIIHKAVSTFLFSVYCVYISLFAARNYRVRWVADPVMFMFVRIAKMLPGRVVWDHHELPPQWVLRHSLLRVLFKSSYQRSDFIIHANERRQEYLERVIDTCANHSAVLKNYPAENVNDSQGRGGFFRSGTVYLQNCLTSSRCGFEIFSAVKHLGYKIIYAGGHDEECLQEIERHMDVGSFCEFLGYVSPPKIDEYLASCEFTVMCYRATSMNQLYCEPNRLYQAMSVGARIVAGNNPTLVDELAGYKGASIIEGDGSETQSIIDAIRRLDLSAQQKPSGDIYSWERNDIIIRSILVD